MTPEPADRLVYRGGERPGVAGAADAVSVPGPKEHESGFRAVRPGETPCAVVTSAGTDEQCVVLTDLAGVADCEIGMKSVVILGNSASRVIGGRMVTVRGYPI